MIAGGRFRGAAIEIHHGLIVPVHEIHLEAADSHFGVFPAGPLHVFVECPVTGPEDYAHSFAFRIFAEHGKVDFRDHLEEVGLFVDSPAFVQDYVFNAIVGREIYVVFVGVVVNARFEIHPVDVPGVPPVPGHLAGTHPAEIRSGGGLGAEQPRQVAGEQVFVFPGHDHYPPGEGLPCRSHGDVGLAALHHSLQHIVPALLDLFGVRSEHGLERGVAVFVGKVHSGIVQKVAFGDADLHSAGSIQGDGQEGQTAFLPFADILPHVEILKGGEELAFESVVALLRVWDEGLGVFREDEFRLLRNHLERSFSGGCETICGTIVICAEDNAVSAALQSKLVVRLLHLRLTVYGRSDCAADATPGGFAHFHVFAKGCSVVQSEGKGRRGENLHPFARNRPCELFARGDFYCQSAGGRLQLIGLVRRQKGHSRKAEQKQGKGRFFHMWFRLNNSLKYNKKNVI